MQVIIGLTVIVGFIATVIGWAINLVSVIKMAAAGAALTTMFVLKVIGIFAAPLGAILGLFF